MKNPSLKAREIIMVKKSLSLAIGLAILLSLIAITGCSGEVYDAPLFGPPPSVTEASSTPQDDVDYELHLDGTSYSVSDASTVSVDENGALVLIKSGVYTVSGSRTGQIQISISKEQRITLILDGVDLHCKDSSAIYVKSADRVYIEAKEGTVNRISDGAAYDLPPYETKPNAAIYSSEDLYIRGSGELIVTGSYNNGIGCKNDLTVGSCKLTVSAPNNAIKGNGSVTLTDHSTVTVNGCEDAIKSDSIDVDKGFVLIDGGANVYISCLDDAIQGIQRVTVTSDAKVRYNCGGSAINCDGLDGTGGIVDIADGSVVAGTAS